MCRPQWPWETNTVRLTKTHANKQNNQIKKTQFNHKPRCWRCNISKFKNVLQVSQTTWRRRVNRAGTHCRFSLFCDMCLRLNINSNLSKLTQAACAQCILFVCTVRISWNCVLKCKHIYNFCCVYVHVFVCLLQCVAPLCVTITVSCDQGAEINELRYTNLGSLTMVMTHFRCGPTLVHVFAMDTIPPASSRPYPYEWLTVESNRKH